MTIKIKQNKQRAEEIKNKLKQNGGYCPCQLLQNEDTKCPCKDFRDMIDNNEIGECHCGLYIIENNE